MGNNRLQYQLLHKNSVQWKSINTKMGLCNISSGKAKVLQQKQLSQETFRNLTPSRKSERIKSGRIVKPKICKIKKPKIAPDNKSTTSVEQDFRQKFEYVNQLNNEIKAETQLNTNKNDNNNKLSRTNENKRKVTLPRSVPTLLVDLRKPLNKWDIGSNPLRQEFNSEINSAFKSMRNIIDEIE
ncbi:hypothetical protein RhiirA4_537831 [Rhizophagus irregularis]|uniref:Uncharacterized protein n=1 Tax=Rhizophagus irregularis TaxID=588596 RepID=A0A2I1FXP9_9GLOM|nr:hypothetical protein RhiirA4_537831 [Rhizophagus irregularis]